MASLQRFSSRGHKYWRIVESYRREDGRPTVRVLMHLGKAEDLLARLEGERGRLRVRSVSSGAVDALYGIAGELDMVGAINRAVEAAGGRVQVRDGLTVGESLLAASVARLCRPSSKRAIAEWAEGTSLPARVGVRAELLTSQHFWDQMEAVPLGAVPLVEEAIVGRVLATEKLAPGLLAYDTTNFFTHIDTANTRTTLAQRGHNKEGRHNLRQVGLALVVSEEGQIPLGHTLYEGARPDVRTFAEVLAPLRRRLRRLVSESVQLTFVFDQGAESDANLAELRSRDDGYVTALKPSHHRTFLAEVADKLEPVRLSTGETIRALKTRRLVHGVEQTVVVTFSETLFEGQRRGLDQSLNLALRKLAKLSPNPRGGAAGARERVARILNRQYVRQILRCEVVEHDGIIEYRPTINEAKRRDLEQRYFGLRILATNHDDWSPAQIIEAYRGQSRVERAFRDLKDPWVGAFRPQFHWTDQKLVVHALIAFIGLLLGRVLMRRAHRHGFRGGLRGLIQRLAKVRTCTVIESSARGRPRASEQFEECSPEMDPVSLDTR
jgi:transposase